MTVKEGSWDREKGTHFTGHHEKEVDESGLNRTHSMLGVSQLLLAPSSGIPSAASSGPFFLSVEGGNLFSI